MYKGVSKMNACGQLGAGSALDSSLNPITNPKDDLKTHFITREGVYKQMTLSEYSRPNRVPLNQASYFAPVRVSFLTIRPTTSNNGEAGDNDILVNGDIPAMHRSLDPRDHYNDSPTHSDSDAFANCDRICFNVGRELYVFVYRGVRNAVDLNKPIDKRVYKGTYPTSHDFNQQTATPTSCSLIIGFSAGQIQLIDPFQKEFQVSRLYNEDRFIDKTAVTCLKWVPGQPQCFLASHSSGNMYLYNEELPCNPGPPSYQIFKQGDGYTVYTCKTKTSRNPIYKWSISTGAVNQFAFSPNNDAKFLATDGFLRVFNYHAMELIGFMKSYFGGLLCLAWSPDARYIVTGGEDDLITVYSVLEKRIVCRGQGHKSWISQVAFDPYTSYSGDGQQTSGVPIDLGSDEDLRPSSLNSSGLLFRGMFHILINSIWIGSVGHDTQLCLWDLTEDVLRQPLPSQRHRNSTIISIGTDQVTTPTSCSVDATKNMNSDGKEHQQSKDNKKFHKRGFSFGAKLAGNSHDRWGRNNSSMLCSDKERRENAVARLLGTPVCPRMDEVTVIEPLICKKIAHERLTGLEFREDCVVTACQEGFILTWARPGKAVPQRRNVNSPIPVANSNIPDGTVV
ncbi:unnamed protein product [Toxocara canis]|uniref:WD_REPEATS_REGION domain-containing protein n=1 Tax=Toxocara canis TaxID=6265 RepID=A0A183URS2_TOXCA|nr:unnamed protein product [Toxocara canis]